MNTGDRVLLGVPVNGCCFKIFQTEPDKEKSFFRAQLERSDFYAFKNGNHFIAFNHRGRIKKIRADENGRSTRKSTLFVLVNPAVTSDDDSKKLFGVDLRRR